MSLKFLFGLLFVTICAIHLIECDYNEYDSTDDDYSPLLGKDKNKEKEQATADKKPPKDFFIPAVSFLPYSQMKTQITINQDKPALPAPPAQEKKKKKPCKHSSHSNNNQGNNEDGNEEGDDFNDGHDDHGDHTQDYSGRSQRSHGRPVVRARHSQDSRVRHSNLPRMREIINKYTIDLVEDSDRY